jgi:hypothetical protein
MGNPVVHFEILCKDQPKMSAFYGELFGWNINTIPQMGYGMVDTDSAGRGIAGGIGSGDEGWVTVYVQVPDAQAALDRAVALGATVARPVMSIPGAVTMGVFRDAEGHCVGLVQE